jgi:cytochrome P450
VLAFDLKRLNAGFLDDPFPTYRALREHDPVHRMPDGSYFLSRYDDYAAVYRDPATWSSDKTVDFRPNLGESRCCRVRPPATHATVPVLPKRCTGSSRWQRRPSRSPRS